MPQTMADAALGENRKRAVTGNLHQRMSNHAAGFNNRPHGRLDIINQFVSDNNQVERPAGSFQSRPIP